MHQINLADCTLSPFGNISEWNVTKEEVEEITENLSQSGVEILEVGSIGKKQYYRFNPTVFYSMEEVKTRIAPKKEGLLYSVLCDPNNPIPLHELEHADEESADLFRVLVAKNKCDELNVMVDTYEVDVDYCKGVIEKGYKLCILLDHVEQYTEDELLEMVQRFAALKPFAMYIADEWGTQSTSQLLQNLHLLDANMPAEILLGYRGSNARMQVLETARKMVNEEFHRPLIIDGGISGIGPHAGTLHLDVFAQYLNESEEKCYNTIPMLEVNDNYIQKALEKKEWGYSFPYYAAALHCCDPEYAYFFSQKMHFSYHRTEAIIKSLSPEERYKYTKQRALAAVGRVKNEKLKICIVTDDNWGNIEHFLNMAKEYMPHIGGEIEIINYGKTGKAKVAVENFLLDGYTNITYRSISEFSLKAPVSLDDLQRAFYSENLDFEYLWFVKDGNALDLQKVNNILDGIKEKAVDCICFNPFPDIIETDADDQIISLKEMNWHKYVERMVAAGAVIVHRDMAKKMLDLQAPKEMGAFWQFWAILSIVAQDDINVYLCRNSLFYSNWFSKSRCASLENADFVDVWCKQWFTMLHCMPHFSEADFEYLKNVDHFEFYPFGLYDIFKMRIQNGLSTQKIQALGKSIDDINPNTVKRMKQIVRIPPFACKFLLKHKDKKIVRAFRSLV